MTTWERLLAVYLVALVGAAALGASPGFVGVAAADAPDCSTMSYQGAGNTASPYQVGTVDQLQCLGHADTETNRSDDFELVSDIDASGTDHWNAGDGFDPIEGVGAGFSGTLDGNGHTITGLSIDRDAAEVGLFESIDSTGAVRNLELRDVDVTGGSAVGALAGRNGGTVESSSVTGTVTGTDTVGGLVGSSAGTVERSYASATVDSTVAGTAADAGGLVGRNTGTVTTSYATGDVTANTDRVGGLVGRNGGTVEQSYAAGSISGGADVGGLVGDQSAGATVANSYWDTDASRQGSSAGSATGLATSEMQRFAPLDTMSAFDFEGAWNVTDGYPRLVREGVAELAVDSLEATDVSIEGGESGTITVTATVSGSSDPSGATVEVRYADGLSGISAGDTVETDADGEAAFTVQASDGGEYTPTFAWAGNTSVTTSSTVTVATVPGEETSLGTDSLTTERGDVVEIPVSLQGTDRATVTIGSVGETGWVQNLTVADGDGDGNVIIEFNTYTAGTGDNGYRVYSLADADDFLTNVARPGGEFVTVDSPGEATLPAGSHPVRVVAGTTPAAWTRDGPDDTATLSLGEPSADALTNYVAPSARAGDVEDPADVAALRASGNLTEASAVAAGDLLVVGVEASGLEGVIRNRTDRTAANATVAFLNEGASSGSGAAFDFRITQLDANGNGASADATLAPNNTALVPDPENGTYWLVVDTGAVPEFDAGDELETGLTLRAEGSLADGADRTVVDEWRIVDRAATLETNAQVGGEDGVVVRNVSGQALAGTTTLAPGTELTVRAEGTDTDGSFVVARTTTVEPNGTFTVTGDFGDVPPVANFSTDVEDGGTSLLDDAVPGRVTGPLVATDDEYEVPRSETLAVPAADGVLSSVENGGGFTLTASRSGGPSNGTLTLSPDGSFEYVPDCEFSGVDAFTYVVSDGEGSTDVATATVTVSDRPERGNFSVSVDGWRTQVTEYETPTVEATVTNEGAVCDTQTIRFTDGFERTVDSRPVTLTAGESTTVALDWTSGATVSEGARVATANDSEQAVVPDEPGNSDSEPVDPNDAPSASGDDYTVVAVVGEEARLAVTAGDGVLANDGDPDGSSTALSVSLVSGPANGALVLDADGSFVYTPDAGGTGTDSFTYEVTDGDGGTDRATVTLTVVDGIEHTVYEDVSAVRQHVGVPANATPTGAERVTFLAPHSGPLTVDFSGPVATSSVRFGSGADLRGNLTVTEFDGAASLPDDAPGQPLVTLRITGSQSVGSASATVRTRVARSTLRAADANASDLGVAHYVDGSWQLSNATVVNRTDRAVTVEFATSGFSSFAVTAVGTPVASISAVPETVTVGEDVALDASDSATPYGEVVGYEWSVDGRTLSGETATVTLDDPGEYTLELRVTNDAGRTATATATVTVETESTGTGTTPTATPGDDPAGTPTSTGENGPGFGHLAAVVAILGLAVALRRR